MWKYNINVILIRIIEQLYDKAASAVQMKSSIGEWFRTTIEVRQTDALEDQHGKVSIGARNIISLRFADDIDALAEEQQELEALVENLDKTCTRYNMEISAEKNKLMTNNVNAIQKEITIKQQKLCSVRSFKYLEAVASDDGSKPDVLSRTE